MLFWDLFWWIDFLKLWKEDIFASCIVLLQYKLSTIQISMPKINQTAFINHCANLIQKNYKCYIQRKRYKQFLPFYRRFRMLLTAMAEGWRVRKIMKCDKIKNMVHQIKDHDLRGNKAKGRILRREFAGDVVRLGKKGEWLREMREKVEGTKATKGTKGIKENISLYCNVKMAGSLKNIFNSDNSIKFSTTNFSKNKKSIPHKNLTSITTAQNYPQSQAPSSSRNRINQFDEIPIKGCKNYDSLFDYKEQEIELKDKGYKVQKMKKKKKDVGGETKEISLVKQLDKKIEVKQFRSLQESQNINSNLPHLDLNLDKSDIFQSIVSPTNFSLRKQKITITQKKPTNTNTKMEKSVQQSINKQQKEQSFGNLNQFYERTYLKKKQQLYDNLQKITPLKILLRR